MFIPIAIAIPYMLLQLYMIEKKVWSFLFISIIVFIIILPLLVTLPVAGNNNDTIIRNDTLFIEG